MKFRNIIDYTLILFFFLISIGCHEQPNSNHEMKNPLNAVSSPGSNNSFDQLLQYARNFEPKDIDLSKSINDSLNSFNMDTIFSNTPSDSLELVSKLFLLKQYLFHLKIANQGYDLYTMRRGNTKKVIDFYLVQNELDTNGEFLNSGVPYILEQASTNKDENVNSLLMKIKIEVKRIANGVGFDHW